MALSAEQRELLLRAQLTSLVRARWGDGDREAVSFPGGAALRAGTTAWVLLDAPDERALGGAALWAAAHAVEELQVIVARSTAAVAGHLARLAGYLAHPVTVWLADGTELAAAAPVDWPPEPPLPVAADRLVAELRSAGLDVVIEHGIARVQVLGLEVGRVIVDDDGARLEPGVGRFDREMSAMMFASMAPVDAVVQAASFVAQHRAPGAPRHPLRDLCPEQWVRATLVAEPSLIDATEVVAVSSVMDRPNLRAAWPAIAIAQRASGPCVVAVTAGIDLGAVLDGADARALHEPEADLVIVSPRPLPASVQGLGARLRQPATFLTVPAPWDDAADRANEGQ